MTLVSGILCRLMLLHRYVGVPDIYPLLVHRHSLRICPGRWRRWRWWQWCASFPHDALIPAAASCGMICRLSGIMRVERAWPVNHGVESELMPVLPRLFLCPRLFSGSPAILFPGLLLGPGLLVVLLTLSISCIGLVWLNSRNLVDLIVPVRRPVMAPLVSEILASLHSSCAAGCVGSLRA